METIAKVSRLLVEEYKLHKWFENEPKDRPYAWDVIKYISKNFPTDTKILEMGCGIGQNLVELWNHGFTNLYGIERDTGTCLACLEMMKHFGVVVEITHWDACRDFIWDQFDIVAPLNFTYSRDVEMPKFLEHVWDKLNPGGTLIIDVIDSEYPSDQAVAYYHRFSEEDFVALSSEWFSAKEIWHRYYPRSIYILEANS